ncbi:hypothetical protein NQ117_16885 [Paenibacillus sp. SC116]|uniref:hypothetical protein n=1 Tax=Paenibacillus sp. SC116 TaxID=2968986 RepID=UPI00215B6F33|nr:hypothetical protein [Paenibacillus sp. SC116]MCR8845359.1 hypothetical protein [Paenibacillus sp. SC116]
MSQANIPNVTPTISITLDDSVNLLLASTALEGLALANIINAEAERIQYVIGTLPGSEGLSPPATISNLLAIDSSVVRTLQEVMKKEILLQIKLDSIMNSLPITPLAMAE